jgi:hypothetical protein
MGFLKIARQREAIISRAVSPRGNLCFKKEVVWVFLVVHRGGFKQPLGRSRS